MNRIFAVTSVIAATVAGAAVAAQPALNTKLGNDFSEIIRALSADGYTIQEIEREHGLIEVEALKEGQTFEIKVDPTSGQVVSIEHDD